ARLHTSGACRASADELGAWLWPELDWTGDGRDHATAVGLVGLDVDLATVELGDPSRNRETEARAARGRGSRGVGAVEPFEHALGLLGRDARTFVEHLDARATGDRSGAHDDGAARGRVPHRVLDEIRDNLVDPLGVGNKSEVARLDLHLEVHVGALQ